MSLISFFLLECLFSVTIRCHVSCLFCHAANGRDLTSCPKTWSHWFKMSSTLTLDWLSWRKLQSFTLGTSTQSSPEYSTQSIAAGRDALHYPNWGDQIFCKLVDCIFLYLVWYLKILTSQVLQLLEEEEDINQIMAYFSYEHFYVIYCKFWELDRDHDLFIDQNDLARHNDHGMLPLGHVRAMFFQCV